MLEEIPVDEIIGERVLLRALDEADVPSLYRVVDENREFLSRHLPWPSECRSQDDLFARIDSWNMQAEMANGACWGIFEKQGNGCAIAGCIVVGWVQWAHRSASVSYWLGERFTGRGLATEALQLVSSKMFSLGLNRLELTASVDNPKSAAVAKRAKFREEGISRELEFLNGKFEDHIRFALLARDF